MNDKYILYTPDTKTEYDSFEEAKQSYNDCKENLKFLYQPDKVYFLGTISSSGLYIGHDHMYHKTTGKCYGLFIADNKNQIKAFLNKALWKHQGASAHITNARLYGNGPYGSLYQSNSDDIRTGWDAFDNSIQQDYLSNGNITFPSWLQEGFGAIDVKTYNGRGKNPYRLH